MIEVGEYVRVNGIIGRVEQVGNSLFWLEDGSSYSLTNKEIKHSKNIINLIEVGDIVNGERILDITGDYIHTNETNHNKFYLAKHIKTILTKEQYQANCYTVERKEEC